jgi:hypothetical protein
MLVYCYSSIYITWVDFVLIKHKNMCVLLVRWGECRVKNQSSYSYLCTILHFCIKREE